MHFINFRRSSLLLLLLVVLDGWDQVYGKQRTSQAQCAEYQKWSSKSGISCRRPSVLILIDHVRPEDYPHHALLGYKTDHTDDAEPAYQFMVSGTLISDRFVLTVAHGTKFGPKQPEMVRLGAKVLREPENALQHDYEIAEIIRHPNYTARLAYNDIALVRLKESVQFSQDIRPACLWDSMDMNFTRVEATGFGFANPVFDNDNRMGKFSLDILSNDPCEELFTRSRRLPGGIMDHQLCLASSSDGDSCSGNSGSPAQITLHPDDCAAYVVGLASFGLYGCGREQQLEVYTRVASFIDWIEDTVWHSLK